MQRMILGALVMVLGAGGCSTYMVAAPSVQGKAYVVRDGASLWNCDATSGTPTCYQAKRQFTPQTK